MLFICLFVELGNDKSKRWWNMLLYMYHFISLTEVWFSMMVVKNHVLTNTPDAPRASALKTSVPRRTPPSRKTGIFPSAAFTTYSRQATKTVIKSMQ